MTWRALNWYALGGFVLLSALATWACVRLFRNGGSAGTPHWDAVGSDPDYGDAELGVTPLLSEPPPVPRLTPEQRAKLDVLVAKVRDRYVRDVEHGTRVAERLRREAGE